MTNREALLAVVKAWEATASGITSTREIQRWLIEDMAPAIEVARAALEDDITNLDVNSMYPNPPINDAAFRALTEQP